MDASEAKAEKEVCGEIESPHPAFLLAQDTCYIGYIKGVGRLYQQTGIDTHANVGFARVYLEKTASVAADFLNSVVFPFYDERALSVLRILTDRDSEYCGRTETLQEGLALYQKFVFETPAPETKVVAA